MISYTTLLLSVCIEEWPDCFYGTQSQAWAIHHNYVSPCNDHLKAVFGCLHHALKHPLSSGSADCHGCPQVHLEWKKPCPSSDLLNYWLVRLSESFYMAVLFVASWKEGHVEGTLHRHCLTTIPAIPDYKVDLAGPLYVRVSDPVSSPKVWLCLYTCCSTRELSTSTLSQHVSSSVSQPDEEWWYQTMVRLSSLHPPWSEGSKWSGSCAVVGRGSLGASLHWGRPVLCQ